MSKRERSKRERFVSIRILPERFELIDRFERAAKTLKLSKTEAGIRCIESYIETLEAEAANVERFTRSRQRDDAG